MIKIIYPVEYITEIIADWLDNLVRFNKIIENKEAPITRGDVSSLASRIKTEIAIANKRR